MTDESDRITAECRQAVSGMATVFVRRDPDSLRYLSGQMNADPTLPASQMMVSSAWLVGDVLMSGLATANDGHLTGAQRSRLGSSSRGTCGPAWPPR